MISAKPLHAHEAAVMSQPYVHTAHITKDADVQTCAIIPSGSCSEGGCRPGHGQDNVFLARPRLLSISGNPLHLSFTCNFKRMPCPKNPICGLASTAVRRLLGSQ